MSSLVQRRLRRAVVRTATMRVVVTGRILPPLTLRLVARRFGRGPRPNSRLILRARLTPTPRIADLRRFMPAPQPLLSLGEIRIDILLKCSAA